MDVQLSGEQFYWSLSSNYYNTMCSFYGKDIASHWIASSWNKIHQVYLMLVKNTLVLTLCKLYWSSKFNYVKLNYNSSSHSSSILNLVSAGISRSVERFFSNAGKKEEKIEVSRDNAPKHRHVAGDVHRAHPKKVFRNHSPTERRHRVKKRKVVDVWRCWNKTALLVYFMVYSPNIYYL